MLKYILVAAVSIIPTASFADHNSPAECSKVAEEMCAKYQAQDQNFYKACVARYYEACRNSAQWDED